MRREIVSTALLSVTTAFMFGCRTTRADVADKMYELAAALTKLTAAVESTVRYKNPPEGADDESLLALATAHDGSLREPFAHHWVRVSRVDGHAVVLVCSADGKVGLLEDAGCSPKLDAHLWKQTPAPPCEFTVVIREACELGAKAMPTW